MTIHNKRIRSYHTGWWRRDVVTMGSGEEGKWWWREVVMKGSGDEGRWGRWEVVMKGSGDEGRWWGGWEVLREGSGDEGKWLRWEVARKGSGDEGKWSWRGVVTNGGGDDGKCWGREVVTKGRRWEVARKGSGEEGKWWQREVVSMGSGDQWQWQVVTKGSGDACKLHGLFWGGSRSTKPCVFPCEVAAAEDERYLVCATGAAAVVFLALFNCFLVSLEGFDLELGLSCVVFFHVLAVIVLWGRGCFLLARFASWFYVSHGQLVSLTHVPRFHPWHIKWEIACASVLPKSWTWMALNREVEHPGWTVTVGNSVHCGPTSFVDEVTGFYLSDHRLWSDTEVKLGSFNEVNKCPTPRMRQFVGWF